MCVFVWLLWLTAWPTEPVEARYEDSLGHWVTPLSLINIITLKKKKSKWSVCEANEQGFVCEANEQGCVCEVNEQACVCEANEQACVCEANEQACVCETNEQACVSEANEQACVCEVNEQVAWSSKGRLIRT